MRRSRKVDLLIVAALSVIVAIAAADALRSSGSSPTRLATPDPSDLVVVPPRQSRTDEIRAVGSRWASHFARGDDPDCPYMTQALCERLACQRPGPRKIKNCTRPTRAYRKTFEGAVVIDVAFDDNGAAARLSNGEDIEFWGRGGSWLVNKLGGNAGRGFFESSEASPGDRFPVITDAAERRESP